MGRSPKPLKILVASKLFDWQEVQALRDQGHTLDSFEAPTLPLSDYDLILGPRSWMMDESHRGYLGVAIKAARAKRYGKKEVES